MAQGSFRTARVPPVHLPRGARVLLAASYAVVAGVGSELASVDQAAMVHERDDLLEQLIVAKARAGHLPT